MQNESRAVKPRDLGVIGHDHVRANFESIGAASASFNYKRGETVVDGVPYLIEVAFGYCGRKTLGGRVIVTGLSCSPALIDPFRAIDEYGRSLGSFLTELRAGPDEPIIVLVHVVCPRPNHLDHGKSSVDLPAEARSLIADLIFDVTKKWTQHRKAEERDHNAWLRRHDQMESVQRVTIKDAAYEVMEEAYMKASGNGRYTANARQIMYAARRHILIETGTTELDDSRFIQQFLVDYMNAKCVNWKVAFGDRGFLREPHDIDGDGLIPLGTLAVDDYIASWAKPSLKEAGFLEAKIKTHGPEGRFAALLYIEKAGFDELIEEQGIAAEYDLVVMSCQGMSVTAARKIVDRACKRYGIPLIVVHDFDVSGFSIAKTVHTSNRRFTFETEGEFDVIDAGLRLEDVEHYAEENGGTVDDLAEPVHFKGKNGKESRSLRLEENGATEEEIAFLLDLDNANKHVGKRVELNAMTSEQFVDLLRRKLDASGIKKVIPDAGLLADAYRLFVRSDRIKVVVEAAIDEMDDEPIDVPADIQDLVQEAIDEDRTLSWDASVRQLVDDDQ
jgi:hypothetical protein